MSALLISMLDVSSVKKLYLMYGIKPDGVGLIQNCYACTGSDVGIEVGNHLCWRVQGVHAVWQMIELIIHIYLNI